MGFHIVDEKARSCGSFEVGGFSPTGALEMMRGDLVEIFYKAADESANVTYKFETTLRSLKQKDDKVTVELENRNNRTTEVEEFDFVVGADGVKSRTRDLVVEEIDCFKPVGAFVAYFSIPKEDHDWPNSRLCQFTKRRIMWLRPIGKDSETTSAYLIHVNRDSPPLHIANVSRDRLAQKEAFAELYHGLGWEAPRVMEQMMKAEIFYFDELMQVKLQKWSQNRVVLVGDAAWAPTPFTGQGNQLAIIGAWTLAQELSRNRSTVAFDLYEKRLRAYVESSQNIPLRGYAPYLFVPSSSLGIWLFRTVFSVFSKLVKFFSKPNSPVQMPEKPEDDFDLEM